MNSGDRAAALRISALFAAVNGSIGFYVPYFPLWLAGKGLRMP